MAPLRIVVGTWNVGTCSPGRDLLSSWLCRSEHPPDIVAVSLQEIVALSNPREYVGKGHESYQSAFLWARLVRNTLTAYPSYQGVRYTVLEYHHMVGVMLCVVVRAHHLPRISEVYCGETGTGNFGLSNKGACAIRFAFQSGAKVRRKRTLCFVGCHLSAHQHEVERRNSDVAAVMSLNFNLLQTQPGMAAPAASVGPAPKMKVSGSAAQVLTINGHDMVYWCGDLNYRIDNFNIHEALTLIKLHKYEQLLLGDQLRAQKILGEIFKGFEEGPITFPPTYKFQEGSNNYAVTKKDKLVRRKKPKERVPSWTDRILWRSNGFPVQQVMYTSSISQRASDHRPVVAEFVLPFLEIFHTSAQLNAQLKGSKSAGRLSRPGSLPMSLSSSWSAGRQRLASLGSFLGFVLPSQHPQSPNSDLKGSRSEVVRRTLSTEYDFFSDNEEEEEEGHSFTPPPRGISSSVSVSVSVPEGMLVDVEDGQNELGLSRDPLGLGLGVSPSSVAILSSLPGEIECACCTLAFDATKVVQGNTEGILSKGGLISLEVGDLVEIFTGPLQDGMAFGRLTRSGRAGFFPVSHVRTMGLFREDPNTGSMHEAANKAVALRQVRLRDRIIAQQRKAARAAKVKQAAAWADVVTTGRGRGNSEGEGEHGSRGMQLLRLLVTSASSGEDGGGGGNSYREQDTDGRWALVRFSYSAVDLHEVSVERGERLEVLAAPAPAAEGSWWMVERENGTRGLVPSLFLELTPATITRDQLALSL